MNNAQSQIIASHQIPDASRYYFLSHNTMNMEIYMETKGGFYISQIKQLQDRIFERLLAENGIEISGGQGRILFVLWKNDYLTINEISVRTSLAKNTVSVVVDGMVNKGILLRETNPQNRRQSIVSLTDYARSLQSRYETVSQQMNTLFYQGFSPEEQDIFERLLARILETLTREEQTYKNTKEDLS